MKMGRYEMSLYEFVWRNGSGICKLTIYSTTFEVALEKAKFHGYTPRKWYNPFTWGNHYIVVS